MKSPSKREKEDDGETLGDEVELAYPDYIYIPVYSVPNVVAETLVGQSPAPGEYKKDKDIGDKAVADDWKEYFASQDRLKYLILALLLLFLLVPLLGLFCCCCCRRCRRCRKRRGYYPIMRWCCSALLAMLAILMLLSLIFAIMAAVLLNKNLKSTTDCYSQSSGGGKAGDNDLFGVNSEYKRRSLQGTNYNQLLKHIEAQSDATRTLVRAEAMRNLSEVLKNIQGAKPLLEELRVELPIAKGLATRFRDTLRAVKQNLKVFLTSQCHQEECGDFYRDNEIRLLDEGCLHYERLPPTEDFTKSIEEILADIFVNYPLVGAQQIIKAITNPMDNLLYKENLYKSAKKLPRSNEASLIEFRVKNNRMENDKKDDSSPAAALRGKMGKSWYRTTLGWLLMLLFLPILLLFGLLVTLFSCKHARRLLCAFKIISFILFTLNLILLLFFLVHGALAHQIFCAGKAGSSKSLGLRYYLPDLRSGDTPKRCFRNESWYEVLFRKEFHVRKDVRESLEKLEGPPILGNLSSNHPQSSPMERELLGDNLFSYNSSHFTHHMCQELVPEPKPGPLPGLISGLDNLTSSLGLSPFLLNQTSYLRAVHKELEQPLAAIVQRLLTKLRQLDKLLSGGYGSLARYMSSLLEKIKQGDLTDEVAGNISYSDLGNVTQNGIESCTPQTRQKLDMDRKFKFDDFCKRIANPMNAIWFWLLVFTLLLLPALCCSNILRCLLCICRGVSQESLVSRGGENCVCHSTLPTELEPQSRCYRYLPVGSVMNDSNPIRFQQNHFNEHYC